MSDELDFVIRRYRQIVPQPQSYNSDVRKLRELRVWLADDVMPILAGFVGRPAFREQATWAVRSFKPGAETLERQTIDRLDQALVQCARAQLRMLDKKKLARTLAQLYPARPEPVGGALQISGGLTITTARETTESIS